MTSALLLATAGLGSGLALLTALRAPRWWLGASIASGVAALAAAVGVLTSGIAWEGRSSLRIGGEAVHLRLDGLSAFFFALVSVVGTAGAVYSRGYWEGRAHPASACTGRLWWSGLLVSLGFVLLASNGLHFLIAWEAFTVCAYFLITLDGQRREVRAAGWLYLAASHAALFLFAFFALLAARTGSWEVGPMQDHAELAPLFWLALAGFGVKAGLFPLHIWLPSAHANAPSHVSAILSGVAIKMGIYGMVRFSGWLPVPDGAGGVVAGLGVLSAILGVAFALGQHDLKRLLAYHSVENIGIILMGLGFALVAAQRGHPEWGAIALAGGLLHVCNHGLFKALLFLGAGSVLHATGTREMSRLGGLSRKMPWTTCLFALGAAAISGLPPLNGFVSEWLIYLGLFEAIQHPVGTSIAAVPAIVLLSVTGALALACFVKVCGVVFLGMPRSARAERAHESGAWMLGPMLGLAIGCVVIGMAPVLFWRPVHSAVAAWDGSWRGVLAPPSLTTLGWIHLLVGVSGVAICTWILSRAGRWGRSQGPTWDCGYTEPTPRMQYTAGSFAAIITEWFAWILRPERHARLPEGSFPRQAEWEEHTPETVLERVVVPAAGIMMRLSRMARYFQHGRVQSYLFYLILGLGALAILATFRAF